MYLQQSTSKSPYSKSEDEVGSSYASPNSPVQRVSLNAPRPYSSGKQQFFQRDLLLEKQFFVQYKNIYWKLVAFYKFLANVGTY